ncbi:hypothetical protein GJ631_09670 [Natronomonas sp. CBA1123]|uniref:hypothetical protein n=1 Tax=Natronomonas sp. CBA1123 TaxID=2668070 RepID=UPI0012EA932E|nr:hypothetical protein [Natronomonas sp. CBA1123]MUV86825.1 hypothetical protein [Natronomonas sp. CBA1123]
MTLSTTYLLRVMALEEWRLHGRMFGGKRFAMFPVFVAAVAAGTAAFFALANADTGLLIAGLHLVVATLGLQVGTVGLVGRDALEDLLGETTLLLFSARTLPVEPKKLLVAFLVKDVAYYAVLFLLPLTVGLVPLVVMADVPAARLPLLFLTSVGMFALSVAASFALVGIHTRSRTASIALVVAVVAALLLDGSRVLAVTPYGLLADIRPLTVAGSLLLPVFLGVVGVVAFRFDRRTPSRTAANRFGWLHRKLGGADEQGLLAKSLLDVVRSSGGLWKVVFSQGLVFAVLAVLLAFLPDVVPVRPEPGLTIAAVLALGSFTTYNWLCQFDDTAFYLRHPVSLSAVFRAKLLGFCLLALPSGLAFLGLGAVVFGTGTMAVGIAVFAPLCLYVFGVTAYVAGLEPTELLFDTPVFAGFTLAMMVVLIPLVVAAIAFTLYPTGLALGSVGYASLSGLAGLGLYRRAGTRWEGRALDGTD